MNKLPDSALPYLGFCRRSGRVIIGTDAIITALRGKRPPYLVIVSSDASERTSKQLSDKCASYSVPALVSSKTGEETARLLGKSGTVMAVAATDEGLAAQMLRLADGN